MHASMYIQTRELSLTLSVPRHCFRWSQDSFSTLCHRCITQKSETRVRLERLPSNTACIMTATKQHHAQIRPRSMPTGRFNMEEAAAAAAACTCSCPPPITVIQILTTWILKQSTWILYLTNQRSILLRFGLLNSTSICHKMTSSHRPLDFVRTQPGVHCVSPSSALRHIYLPSTARTPISRHLRSWTTLSSLGTQDRADS